LERTQRDEDEVRQLRREELDLLRRDAALAPQSAALQYRLGLSLYLHRHYDESEKALLAACQQDPLVPEFRMGLTLFYEELQQWDKALASAEKLVALRPDDPTYQQVKAKIERAAQNARATVSPP
jgi:tetratricopeptide (TPR) repeat protein